MLQTTQRGHTSCTLDQSLIQYLAAGICQLITEGLGLFFSPQRSDHTLAQLSQSIPTTVVKLLNEFNVEKFVLQLVAGMACNKNKICNI